MVTHNGLCGYDALIWALGFHLNDYDCALKGIWNLIGNGEIRDKIKNIILNENGGFSNSTNWLDCATILDALSAKKAMIEPNLAIFFRLEGRYGVSFYGLQEPPIPTLALLINQSQTGFTDATAVEINCKFKFSCHDDMMGLLHLTSVNSGELQSD
jgi:hypothetical protein